MKKESEERIRLILAGVWLNGSISVDAKHCDELIDFALKEIKESIKKTYEKRKRSPSD
uniref:Uncharacterized protein n=1 Tax=viral metagenome TaxID=1070528 RepID=A0A6M3JZ30_9ZZZZ